MRDKAVAFIGLNLAEDYVKCGWIPLPAFDGSRHGMYAVMMEHIECACGKPIPEPKKRKQ